MASSVEILLRAKDFASDKITKLKNRIQGLGKGSADSAAGTDRLSGSVSRLTSRIGAFIGATAGFVAVKGLFEGVINTGAKFETLNTQLAAVMGTAEQGEQAFAWIKEFTKNTPFQLDQVTSSFIKLKSFGLDPMDGTMLKLVDTASKLGGSQEALNGIILAVGQAWSKQKLQGEEALQLIERGVPVWDLLSKALGKTTAEIQQMSQKGELGRDAIQALITAMGDSSIGAAAEQMKTFSGVVSNLKDTFTEFLNTVADQGALDYFKAQLSELADTIKRMREDGSLKDLAKEISDFMIRAAEATKAVVSTIIKFSSELKVLATAFIAVKVGQFAAGMLLLSANILKAAASMRILRAALIATPFGAIGLAIGYVAEKLIDMNDQTRLAANLSLQAQQNKEKEAQIWKKLSDRVGIQIKNEQDLNQAKKDGLIVFDEQTKQYERVTTETQKATAAGDDYTNMLKSFNAELANNAGKTKESLTATQEFRSVLKEMASNTDGLAGALSDLTNNEFVRFSEQARQFADSPFSSEIEKSTVQVALLAESLDRANVDVGLFETGISSAGAEAIAGFNNITNAANTSARQIGVSLDSTLTAVRTQQGFKQLREQIVKLGDSGKLMGVDLANALKKVDDAAKSANDSLSEITSSINGARTIEELNAVGDAAHQAMDRGKITAQEYLDVMTDVDSKLADVNDKLSTKIDNQNELNDAGSDTGTTDQLEQENEQRTVSLDLTERQGKALYKAQQQTRENILATASQKVGLEEYNSIVASVQEKLIKASEGADKFAASILDITENGHASEQQMQRYVASLERAINNGKDLDEQALSNLQAALSAAKSKMEALKNETQSTASEVASLEGELAALNGNDQRVQQLQYQQRRLEIEQKIQQAQAQGNVDAVNNLKQSLSLLSEINRKKQAAIRADKQAAKTEPTNNKPAKPDKTVKLQFQSPTGKQASATVDARGATDLIDVLKQAGAVTR